MVVELLYRQGFNEEVGQVFLSVDLLKIDITSIHDLSDQMEVTQNVLRPLVCFGFFHLSYDTSAVAVEQEWTIEGGCYSELGDKFSQQIGRAHV